MMPENLDFQDILVCPLDGTKLQALETKFVCERQHSFSIEQGVPVFTDTPRREDEPRNLPPCTIETDGKVDRFVNNWIVNTNGNLYWKARGHLKRYPIPQLPFAALNGKFLVDLGCGWGRWCLAADDAGFSTLGVDVHLDALQAAGRVFKQLKRSSHFLCSDIEWLPIASAIVDVVFSYSVLQHLERDKVVRTLQEASRILKPGGQIFIQLPNAAGLFSKLQQMRRGFREAKRDSFEMRYWSKRQILEAFERAGFRDIEIEADGFFSQNPQLADLDLLAPLGKLIVLISYVGRSLARAIPPLTAIADSLWIKARTPE
jgi:ubiquinone/menaquinone biosynthesis C-methylase UbiE/uncharacterized protein YbaR (Trm112 family)